MGKNLVATCSVLIKRVRSCQIYYQLLDLCHLKKLSLFFCKDLFKQKSLHKNNVSVAKTFSSSKPKKLTKSHDMTCPTFSKLTQFVIFNPRKVPWN